MKARKTNLITNRQSRQIVEIWAFVNSLTPEEKQMLAAIMEAICKSSTAPIVTPKT